MDHFKWHYLPTVRYTFHKSWESTWKIKHLLFLPYIVLASSTVWSWGGGRESSVWVCFSLMIRAFYLAVTGNSEQNFFIIWIFSLHLFTYFQYCRVFSDSLGSRRSTWERSSNIDENFLFVKASVSVVDIFTS